MSIYFHSGVSTLFITHYYISNQREVFTVWNIVLLRIYHCEGKLFSEQLEPYHGPATPSDLKETDFKSYLLLSTSAIVVREERMWITLHLSPAGEVSFGKISQIIPLKQSGFVGMQSPSAASTMPDATRGFVDIVSLHI